MFTGIVEGTFQVAKVEETPGLKRIWIDVPEGWLPTLDFGQSIAVNGVCLTVAEIDRARIRFDAMQETLQVTTLGGLMAGDSVNLERSARFGDPIGGHLLSGHVDARAELLSIDRPENNYVLKFKVGADWMKYIFSKGFLGINGCSLTVVNPDKAGGIFSVWLIPETLRLTTFKSLEPGQVVNIEIDRQTQTIVDTISQMMADGSFQKEQGLV